MTLKYKNVIYTNIKQVLKNEFHISDRLITVLKKNNCLYLNNENVGINTSISKGDEVTISLDFDEEENLNIVPTDMSLNILYEDEALLIIDKPSNMPIHPSILHYTDTLSNGVKFYFDKINLKKKIRPINRLDKDTSGIVIFAKNQYVQEELVKQMNSGLFKKEYNAILVGSLKEKSGTINAPIARKENSIIEREVNKNGEKAITHFELIKKFKYDSYDFSFVKFILETGRTHQIRVHSKYIGHPILGDSLYGEKTDIISRQALHACRVSFIHPINKKIIKIESALPDDIKRILKES